MRGPIFRTWLVASGLPGVGRGISQTASFPSRLMGRPQRPFSTAQWQMRSERSTTIRWCCEFSLGKLIFKRLARRGGQGLRDRSGWRDLRPAACVLKGENARRTRVQFPKGNRTAVAVNAAQGQVKSSQFCYNFLRQGNLSSRFVLVRNAPKPLNCCGWGLVAAPPPG